MNGLVKAADRHPVLMGRSRDRLASDDPFLRNLMDEDAVDDHPASVRRRSIQEIPPRRRDLQNAFARGLGQVFQMESDGMSEALK
jgi:hypothetical protein